MNSAFIMIKLRWLFTYTLLCIAPLFAYQNNEYSALGIPSLEELETELKHLYTEYHQAAAAFNPWYSGPLLTPSAHCVPPGKFNVQPYWFYNRINSTFDANEKKVSSISTTQHVVQAVIQAGLVERLDFSLIVGTQVTHQNGETKAGYQDMITDLGFQVLSEGHFRPAIRMVAGITLPAGRYRHLNPTLNAIDASGGGAYAANVGIVMSKVVWWLTPHPFQYRFSCQYTMPGDARVEGFHAYGGGFGTKGRVDIGKSLNALSSFEYSLTKQWVFALDFAFNYHNKSTFKGTPGVTATGAVAGNTAPSSYALAIAPAIEYNFNDTFGVLLGGQTVVWGRNEDNLSSFIATFTYSW